MSATFEPRLPFEEDDSSRADVHVDSRQFTVDSQQSTAGHGNG